MTLLFTSRLLERACRLSDERAAALSPRFPSSNAGRRLLGYTDQRHLHHDGQMFPHHRPFTKAYGPLSMWVSGISRRKCGSEKAMKAVAGGIKLELAHSATGGFHAVRVRPDKERQIASVGPAHGGGFKAKTASLSRWKNKSPPSTPPPEVFRDVTVNR